MKKRYTDTDKWLEPWYSELKPQFKLLYQYILDTCDPVGVWEPNFPLAKFQVSRDEEIDWNQFKKELGNRLYIIPDGKWYMVDFCKFQYAEILDQPKDEKSSLSKPHQSYKKTMIRHGIWDAYRESLDDPRNDFSNAYLRLSKANRRGINSPKDKDKEKDQEKGTVKEKDIDTDKVKDMFQGTENEHTILHLRQSDGSILTKSREYLDKSNELAK